MSVDFTKLPCRPPLDLLRTRPIFPLPSRADAKCSLSISAYTAAGGASSGLEAAEQIVDARFGAGLGVDLLYYNGAVQAIFTFGGG
jgi:hypothetical protein